MNKPLNKIYEYIENPAIYKIYDKRKDLLIISKNEKAEERGIVVVIN